jgi:hypothetical protein
MARRQFFPERSLWISRAPGSGDGSELVPVFREMRESDMKKILRRA